MIYEPDNDYEGLIMEALVDIHPEAAVLWDVAGIQAFVEGAHHFRVHTGAMHVSDKKFAALAEAVVVRGGVPLLYTKQTWSVARVKAFWLTDEHAAETISQLARNQAFGFSDLTHAIYKRLIKEVMIAFSVDPVARWWVVHEKVWDSDDASSEAK